MIECVPDILARIVAAKREELAAGIPAREQLESAAEAQPRRPFAQALRARTPAVIAEVKKASPSKGLLAEDFNPVRAAKFYENGGAAALSVLTDQRFFQGSLEHLETARSAVSLPVLRKDFTIDSLHVVEAAAHGADAILLIAAILTEQEMREFRELASTYGMAALVEVHDDRELQSALASGAEIVGVNNRNLRTFEVTLETSLRLAEQIPEKILRVSESGIRSRTDIERLQAAGYHAFLVGEHLMKAADPSAALRALVEAA